MQELEDTKKLAQSLLVRVSDSASGDRHMVGYGPNDTQWISDQLARKPKPTNTSASAADIAIQKCNVVECNYDAVEGYCGNSGCSHFHFCDIHLNHNSHSNHEVRQEVSNFIINTRRMMFKRIQFFTYYVYPYSSSRHHQKCEEGEVGAAKDEVDAAKDEVDAKDEARAKDEVCLKDEVGWKYEVEVGWKYKVEAGAKGEVGVHAVNLLLLLRSLPTIRQ